MKEDIIKPINKTNFCQIGLTNTSQKTLLYNYTDFMETSTDTTYKMNVYTNYQSNVHVMTQQGIILRPTRSHKINTITSHYDGNAVFIKETYTQYVDTATYLTYESLLKYKDTQGIHYSQNVKYGYVEWYKDPHKDMWKMHLNVITIIPESTLIKKNILYIRETNLVINIRQFDKDYIHPVMSRDNMYDLYSGYPGHHCYFEIIDNSNPNKLYYTKIGGNIITLTSAVSAVQTDGIYFNTRVIGETPKSIEIPLKDIETYGIYHTEYEAINAEEYRDTAIGKELTKAIESKQKDINKIEKELDKKEKEFSKKEHDLTLFYDKKQSTLLTEYEKSKQNLEEKLEKYKEKIVKEQDKLDKAIEVELIRLDNYRKESTYDTYVNHCKECESLAKQSLQTSNSYIQEALKEKRIESITNDAVKEAISKFNINIPINLNLT